jgi:hypothetical protein
MFVHRGVHVSDATLPNDQGHYSGNRRLATGNSP